MRIALLADIHGNIHALEAVITEIERLQPDQVVVDGDLINAVPFSGPVIDRIRRLPWAVVRGNHEFYYLDHGTERAGPGRDDPDRWGQLHWLVKQITVEQGAYAWLRMHPSRPLVILGTNRLERIAHAAEGAEVTLSREEWYALWTAAQGRRIP